MLKGWDSLENRKACDRFIDGSIWKKICHDKYYERVLRLYRDNLVSLGESYAIFQLEKSEYNEMMVFSRFEEIANCDFIKALGMNKFQCMNQLRQKVYDLATGRSVLACLPYRFQLTEELYSHCAHNNTLESSEIKSTLLYYANIGYELDKPRNFDLYGKAVRIRGEPTDVILFLSALLLIILLRFWT